MNIVPIEEQRKRALETYEMMCKETSYYSSFIKDAISKHEPDGKIIEDFLLWAIDNDYIEFDKLLYLPENINVKTDIATELIIKYLTEE
jgi:hypothetical protein